MAKSGQGEVLIQIRKWHALMGLAMGLVIPSVSVVAAYYSKQTAVADMIHAVEKKIADQKLEGEMRFAKKEEVDKVGEALKFISGSLIELKTDVKHLRIQIDRR